MSDQPTDKAPKQKEPKIDTTLGHLQPQAVEMEQMVLGGLLIDKDAFSVVSEMLHPETFYDIKHQKIYSAIEALNMDESPVDILTVAEKLRSEGKLEEVGGPSYIMDLSYHVASSVRIDYYASILTQKYLARQLITFASQVQDKAFNETVNVDDLMQETEASLFKISQKNLRQDYTHVEPVVKEALDILQKAAANKGGLTGITTGYEKLDEYTAGWQKSDLVIIAGRPAMGKTAFALSLAKNIAVDNNKPIAFFSLEMSAVQLTNRLIANVCEIDGKKILSGQLDDDEWKRIDSRVGALQGAPIYIDDTPGMSIFELRTKARRLVREQQVEIIMIDYLQLMNATGARFGSRQEEVSTISRSLKSLAKELNVPILALSQLNRTVESREGLEGKRPQLSDLRESGAIEQDADMVLFVHRPEYYRIYLDEKGNDLHGKAQIIIAKHRKGGVGDVLLNFQGEYTRFSNPGDTDYKPLTPSGEIVGSKLNAELPPPEAPFDLPSNMSSPF